MADLFQKQFFLDVWKAAAYYDFEKSFILPDTFYLSNGRIDWIFTGKAGKILKKKQIHSTVENIKTLFCSNKEEDDNGAIAAEIVVNEFEHQYEEKQFICYYQYLNLSEVCELLSKTMAKQDSVYDYQQLPTKKAIQLFNKDNESSRSMIKVEWKQNGHIKIIKRVNCYESFRESDDYKKYIIFDDESFSFYKDDLTHNQKNTIVLICNHIAKSMHLIHNERGRVSSMVLFFRQNKDIFSLVGNSELIFSRDSELALDWRVSYSFPMKFPNETQQSRETSKQAQIYLEQLEKNKNKVLQCQCCLNFSESLYSVSTTILPQLRARRGVEGSVIDIKPFQRRDFCDVCQICYDLFLNIHSIQENTIHQIDTIQKKSISCRSKRSFSNQQSSIQSKDQLKIRNQMNSFLQGNSSQERNSSYSTSSQQPLRIQKQWIPNLVNNSKDQIQSIDFSQDNGITNILNNIQGNNYLKEEVDEKSFEINKQNNNIYIPKQFKYFLNKAKGQNRNTNSFEQNRTQTTVSSTKLTSPSTIQTNQSYQSNSKQYLKTIIFDSSDNPKHNTNAIGNTNLTVGDLIIMNKNNQDSIYFNRPYDLTSQNGLKKHLQERSQTEEIQNKKDNSSKGNAIHQTLNSANNSFEELTAFMKDEPEQKLVQVQQEQELNKVNIKIKNALKGLKKEVLKQREQSKPKQQEENAPFLGQLSNNQIDQIQNIEDIRLPSYRNNNNTNCHNNNFNIISDNNNNTRYNNNNTNSNSNSTPLSHIFNPSDKPPISFRNKFSIKKSQIPLIRQKPVERNGEFNHESPNQRSLVGLANSHRTTESSASTTNDSLNNIEQFSQKIQNFRRSSEETRNSSDKKISVAELKIKSKRQRCFSGKK